MISRSGLASCVFLVIAAAGVRSQPAQESDIDAPPPGAAKRLGTIRLRDFIHISSFAVSGDGKIIAIPDAGGIRVCDIATGKRLRLIKCSVNFGNPLAISKDGRILAAMHGNNFSVWDLATGNLLSTRAEKQNVQFVLPSSDGSRIAVGASGFKSAAPFVWDAQAGKEILRGPELIGYGGKMALAADGKRIAFLMSSSPVPNAADKVKLEVWDIDDGTPIRSIKPMAAAVTIALSPDGKRLAAITASSTIEIWDVDRGILQTRLANRRAAYLQAAFSADGRRLAAVTNFGHVVVWDLTKNEPLADVHDRPLDHGLGVGFTAAGKLLAWGIEGVSPVIWEPETGTVLNTAVGHSAAVTALQFSPDGKHLTSAATNAEVIAWDLASGRAERVTRLKPEGDNRGVPTINAALSLSTNGQLAVLNGTFDGIHLFDLPKNKQLLSFQAPNSSTRLPVALSPDCLRLACGDLDGGITVWSTRTGESLFSVADPGRQVIRAAFAPDGKHLALIDKALKNPTGREQPATVRLFGVPSGKLIAELAEIVTPFSPPALTFSPDSSMIAVANTKTIDVLKIPSGKRVAQYEGLAANLAFGPDSISLAAALGVVTTSIISPVSEEAGNPERIVHVLEIGSDAPRHVFRAKGPIPLAMTFSPDGRLLATAGHDTSIVLWPLVGGGSGGKR